MSATAQKRIESLEAQIEGLQDAIRRQAQENEQSLSVLSKVRNQVEIHERRLEQVDLRLEQTAGKAAAELF